MKLGIDIEKFKGKLNYGNICKSCSGFLLAKVRWFIYAFLIISSAYCIYLWYGYILHPNWSDKKKNEYMRSQDKGIIFNRERFEDIVAESERRKKEFDRKIENTNDIFRLAK